MLKFDDKRWDNLEGGYKTQFDPRPWLSKLETAKDTKAIWEKLWEELHHQGDVGEASYAAVPHLVKIHRKRGIPDWNTYYIVAIIELSRIYGQNPKVPKWLEKPYFAAIPELAEIGSKEVLRTNDKTATRGMLGIIALSKGLKLHARCLVNFSDEEYLLQVQDCLPFQ